MTEEKSGRKEESSEKQKDATTIKPITPTTEGDLRYIDSHNDDRGLGSECILTEIHYG